MSYLLKGEQLAYGRTAWAGWEPKSDTTLLISVVGVLAVGMLLCTLSH